MVLHGDILNSTVLQVIKGWIKSHVVCAVWLGTPCSSWSSARHDLDGCGPRGFNHILGRPDLSAADQHRVCNGNATALVSASIARLCHKLFIPCGLENPSTSLIWKCPYLQGVLKQGQSACFDYCQYGEPWRKRTRIHFWKCCDVDAFALKCSGKKGFCSRTNARHVILTGYDKNTRMKMTKRAEPYPRQLCNSLATILLNSSDQWVDAHANVRVGV